jgi:Carboxypeptidase regulatory-like domain
MMGRIILIWLVSATAVAAQSVAFIDGHVSTADGRPVDGAEVMLLRRQYVQGEARFLRMAIATTDPAGGYRLTVGAAGRYVVAARPMTGGVGACTYFLNAPDPQSATPIEVAVGDVIADVALRLPELHTVAVTGTVRSQDGGPISNALVTAIAHHGIVGLQGSHVRTTARGDFILTNLCPGDYTIQAISATGSDAARSGFQKLSVDRDNVREVSIMIPEPVSITGRLLVDGKAPPPKLDGLGTVRILSLYTDPQRFDPVSFAVVQDDGTFVLQSPPGLAVLRVIGLRAPWTLKAVRVNGGIDVTNSGVELGAASGLVVDLTRRPSVLTGTVAAEGECAVVVFSQDVTRWTYLSTHVSAVSCDRDRRFRIAGLPPGDYQAVAVRATLSGDLTDPQLVGVMRAFSTAVKLREAAETTITLHAVGMPK